MSPIQPSFSPAKARFLQIQGLFRQGAIAEAEREVSAALKTASKDPNLLHLAAQITEAKGERPRAVMLYRKALKVYPEWLEAEYNLARTLADTGALQEGLRLMQKVAQKRPDLPLLQEGLAKLRQRAKDLPGAIEAWDRAIALAPTNESYLSNAALLRAQICDWSRPVDPAKTPLSPQATFVFTDDPALQREAAERHAARAFGRIPPLPPMGARKEGPLRIGFLSGDFKAHATSWLMAELFELQDRTSFELFAYSTAPDDGSPIRKRIEQGVDHFVDIANAHPFAAADRIRADAIDTLIDLKGYTRGSRMEILARRPARVQLHWLGYPGTLGCPFIDGFLADQMVLPPSLERFFTEKIYRLPDCYQINDRKRALGPEKTRESYGLPANRVVLASFNQTYKITPEVFDIWMKIMHMRQETVLWLLESNPLAAANLRAEAAKRDIDSNRLFFAAPCSQEDHLARYRCVDLALDTFPVGGHTTTSDALWAGTPVVTRLGKSFISRVAASLLCAVGLPQLITQDPEGLFETVVRLIDQPAQRAALRKHLESSRSTAPLFDTPRFVKAFEALLTQIWEEKGKAAL